MKFYVNVNKKNNFSNKLIIKKIWKVKTIIIRINRIIHVEKLNRAYEELISKFGLKKIINTEM